MSADFSLSSNLQFDNNSLKSSCNVVAVVSELNLSIFGRIFPEGVALLGFIVLISFTILDTFIPSSLKDFWFPILFLMSSILAWISYFLIALSTGSKIVLDSLLTIYEFWFISKVDTAFLKKVFSASATPSSFCIRTRHFQWVLFEIKDFLYPKKRFYCFPKNFVIFNKRWIKVIEEFFSFFLIKSATVVFFYHLKVFSEFSVLFLKYSFFHNCFSQSIRYIRRMICP